MKIEKSMKKKVAYGPTTQDQHCKYHSISCFLCFYLTVVEIILYYNFIYCFYKHDSI